MRFQPISAILLFPTVSSLIGDGMRLPVRSTLLLRDTRRRTLRQFLSNQQYASFGDEEDVPNKTNNAKSVAVVGGGLAGLSVSYQLLEKTKGTSMQLTIIDKDGPGEGGASSVAGGLLHPFSPRGKLIHMGMEGLEVSSRLINIASQREPDCVLRDKLYRIAQTEAHVEQLTKAADAYPNLATWLTQEEISGICGTQHSLGGLELTSGCKVIHVPSYLKGLWMACQELSSGTARWAVEENVRDWKSRLSEYDAVVFAAGSGLFHNDILCDDAIDFPAEIVRGQSIEMKANEMAGCTTNEAVLCGKYVTPMLQKGQMLIGATHEYKAEALSEAEVWDELKNRSYQLAPDLWDHGTVGTITSGYRVQSKRGKYGRLPVIGRSCGDIHDNSWLFTGLSSRGLIYHGVFGDILSSAIVENSETSMLEQYPDLNWWKKS
jgi:glycine/D-amino acid oxidase-like deaminating enzyme